MNEEKKAQHSGGEEAGQSEEALRKAQEAEAEAQWIRAYTEQPQTEEEFGWVDAVALEFAKDHPWPEEDNDRPPKQ